MSKRSDRRKELYSILDKAGEVITYIDRLDNIIMPSSCDKCDSKNSGSYVMIDGRSYCFECLLKMMGNPIAKCVKCGKVFMGDVFYFYEDHGFCCKNCSMVIEFGEQFK
jgi:hypothetical protein